MERFRYIIIGGGMTGDAAVRGIRKVDEDGSIAMFSQEQDPPYNRPLLTKGLWKGKTVDQAWRRTDQFNVKITLGCKITAVDPASQTVKDERGIQYEYDRLLLATGGSPRRLPFGQDDILYYRTMQNYFTLRKMTEKGAVFAVIGGGFIGSEIAAALAMNGKNVTMVFPEEGIGALVYPKDISHYLNEYFQSKGVVLLTGETLSEINRSDEKLALKTNHGKQLDADGVVAGIGIKPNTGLAEAAGLQTDKDGIVVNDNLLTSASHIFAAGDVASFYNPSLDRRMHVEHEDNANSMGGQAGENMANDYAGKDMAPYTHLPYFYSDLFDIGYEAVGELDSRLGTFADWKEPYKKGVVYYMKEGRVRGVLLWNVWSKLDAARKLIADPGPFSPEDLKGKIQ